MMSESSWQQNLLETDPSSSEPTDSATASCAAAREVLVPCLWPLLDCTLF